MTPEKALEIARTCDYYHPEAAALLMQAACDPTPSEARVRACRALLLLDAWEDVLLATDEVVPHPSPSDRLARAIGIITMQALQDTSRRERMRLAGLVQKVLDEATRVQANRERRAA
jgi:hypothetical protein